LQAAPTSPEQTEHESENTKLKRMVAQQMLVIDGLKEFSRKNFDADQK
jgi:hypothetical protein